MGQIIGSAAKPKRCNISKLSQLGTPAAGEYILVSSDNSMNAAGQGNFDCYIEGDGQKAATALELKPLADATPTRGSKNSVSSGSVFDISQEVAGKNISVSNWVNGSLTNTNIYESLNYRIICTAIIRNEDISYNIQSGYAISIHEYSLEFNSPQELVGSAWIKQTSSWLEGSGVFTPDANTKTIAIIITKTPANSYINISTSVGSYLLIEYDNAFSIEDVRRMLLNQNGIIEKEVLIENQPTLIWYQGSLKDNKDYDSTSTTAPKRIICTLPMPIKMQLVIADGYSCAINEYSELFDTPPSLDGSAWIAGSNWKTGTYEFTPLPSSKTAVLILAKGNRSVNISPSEGSNLSITEIISVKDVEEKNSKSINDINEILYGKAGDVVTESVMLEQGAMMANGTKAPSTDSDNNRRIRTQDFLYVHGDFSLTFTNNVQYNIFFYSDAEDSAYESQIGAWKSDATYNGSWYGYIRFGIRYSNSAIITPSATNVTITHNKEIIGLIDNVLKLEDGNGYCWDTNMVKRKVNTTRKGFLTYIQSFCIYDGKYYSINGSSIAEQDGTFSVLRNVSLALGHGNALHLGENGHAWASGWNDNKLYEVDLSTLSIISTISLPTSGYTTAAVDEKNMIAYIFQRSSYPDTIATYKFIVYDITNQQIISEKYIEDFSAMQSVDFYKGKIYILYGLGTSASPSGMMVYDTSGNVLAEYSLDIFSSTEPEGVCVERNNKQLYVSDVNGNLYEVSE